MSLPLLLKYNSEQRKLEEHLPNQPKKKKYNEPTTTYSARASIDAKQVASGGVALHVIIADAEPRVFCLWVFGCGVGTNPFLERQQGGFGGGLSFSNPKKGTNSTEDKPSFAKEGVSYAHTSLVLNRGFFGLLLRLFMSSLESWEAIEGFMSTAARR